MRVKPVSLSVKFINLKLIRANPVVQALLISTLLTITVSHVTSIALSVAPYPLAVLVRHPT